MRAIAELTTGFVVILLAIGVYTSLPYALRELRRDWLKLRGQFGLAFCLICIGAMGRLAIVWAFYQVNGVRPAMFWRAAEPVGLVFTVLISAGILIAIRAMTLESGGEKVWTRSAALAAALTTLLWFIV